MFLKISQLTIFLFRCFFLKTLKHQDTKTRKRTKKTNIIFTDHTSKIKFICFSTNQNLMIISCFMREKIGFYHLANLKDVIPQKGSLQALLVHYHIYAGSLYKLHSTFCIQHDSWKYKLFLTT